MLNRFPTYRTSDPDKFRDTANDVFAATRATIPTSDNFEVWAQFTQLNDIALATGGSTTGFSLIYPECDFARIQFARKGRGTCTVANLTSLVENGQAFVTSPGQAARMDYGEGHERLTLRLPTNLISQKLMMLTGVQPQGQLDFCPELSLITPATRGLFDLVSFLEFQLDAAFLSLTVIHEIEQAIVTSFLFATKHRFSRLLEQGVRDAAPHQVRLAEEFIVANWNRPIRIEDLVAITNVSARSLFRSFREARSYSPLAFAKMVRLKRAKEMLSESNPNTSVTGVACYCGFSNLGHFAKDYNRAFGELPSATLERARYLLR